MKNTERQAARQTDLEGHRQDTIIRKKERRSKAARLFLWDENATHICSNNKLGDGQTDARRSNTKIKIKKTNQKVELWTR